jgi:hypothetical protein
MPEFHGRFSSQKANFVRELMEKKYQSELFAIIAIANKNKPAFNNPEFDDSCRVIFLETIEIFLA